MPTIEKRIYDGNRAREILENEVFAQVFDDIEQELFETWKKTPARDVEGREKLHQYQTMLQKIKLQLQTTLDTGKLALMDLNHQRSMAEKAKEFLGMN